MGNIQDSNQASKNLPFHFLQASSDQVPSGGANNFLLTMTLKKLLTQLATKGSLELFETCEEASPASSYQSRRAWVSHWLCPSLSLVQTFQIPSWIINGAPHTCGTLSVGSPEEEHPLPPHSDWFGFPQFTQNLLREGYHSHHNGLMSPSCPSQMQRPCAEVMLGQLVSDSATLGLSTDSHH